MATLSVVLATYNEEENLARCLTSVKDIADEIVIVDGTSTDKTVEIAKKYGAKVKVTDNPPIFHINKQKAIDMATKDWILQLDADEVVSDELAEEIKQVIQKGHSGKRGTSASRIAQDDEEIVGYWMPRKNYFLGKFLMKGGQYPDYTLRLYKKGLGRLPMKDVHEQAVVEGKVGYLKHALLHYPYKDFKTYLHKWDRYNTLTAAEIQEKLKKKNKFERFIEGVGYVAARPAHWMLTTYIRHKGFYDSWQGFVFSLFSALRFPASYAKYLKKK